MLEFDLISEVVVEIDIQSNTIIETQVIDGVVVEFSLTSNLIVESNLSQSVLVFEIMTGGIGPPGPVGPAGGSIVTYPAGQNMSAGRAVIVEGGEAFYFQSADSTHAGRLMGITVSSATTGNDVDIQVSGVVVDASYSTFDNKILWVGTDGELQDTPPTSILLQKAGVGIGANKIAIDFSQQIVQIT